MRKKEFDFQQYLNQSVVININRPNRQISYRGKLVSFRKCPGVGTILMLQLHHPGRLYRWVQGPRFDTDSIAIDKEEMN